MAKKDRETLKNYFLNGMSPSSASFDNLIDSCVNKIDDGFSKTEEDGLMLSNSGDSENLISFYDHIEDNFAQWVIQLNRVAQGLETRDGLHFVTPETKKVVLSLLKEGKVGINQVEPRFELDVNGFSGSRGRAGTYSETSTIPADGQWYPVADNLNHCNSFEVVARTGIKGTGKHSLLHAVAMSAYGHSFSRIRRTRARYSFWRACKIQIRWAGDTFNYRLEMRTRRNLGAGVQIKYYITQLWDDPKMGIPVQFADTDPNTPNV